MDSFCNKNLLNAVIVIPHRPQWGRGKFEKNEGLRNRGSTVDSSRNNSVLMQMLQYGSCRVSYHTLFNNEIMRSRFL